MRDELKKYLFDINESIEHILLFTKDTKTLNEYTSNIFVKRAVERELEIIGEAMKEALVIDSELPVSNARKIVNARNKIIHGYDEVDDAVIWSIVIRHIPILRKEIVDLLNS